MLLNLNQISKIPMKIDKQKLVELLVEKTRMDEEEVRSQLDQLIERIIDAAKRGKALEIREFGLFYFDENGELKFDPSDELSTEISFKYAGMKPVELKGERDSTFPDIEEDDDLEDFDFLSDLSSDESNLYPGTDEEKDVFEEDEKPAGKKEKPPFKSNRHKNRERSGSILWVFAAVAAVAILVLAYLYFIGSSATSTEEPSPAVTQVEPDALNEMDPDENEQPPSAEQSQSGQPDETTASENDKEPAAEPSGEVISSESSEPAGQPEVLNEDQPLYGLQGLVLDEANNGYSIVLHSFSEESTARTTAEDLTSQGYRAIVSSRTVGDRAMWRVSVGQFETLQDAQAATQNLPSPYNTQNFIHRIQLN